MSKIGLSARIAAIVAAAEKANPLAARIHRMGYATRLRYDLWRDKCERIFAEAGDPAEAFEALANGTIVTPEPPRAVADALGWIGPPIMTTDMTTEQCARAYEAFREG